MYCTCDEKQQAELDSVSHRRVLIATILERQDIRYLSIYLLLYGGTYQ